MCDGVAGGVDGTISDICIDMLVDISCPFRFAWVWGEISSSDRSTLHLSHISGASKEGAKDWKEETKDLTCLVSQGAHHRRRGTKLYGSVVAHFAKLFK